MGILFPDPLTLKGSSETHIKSHSQTGSGARPALGRVRGVPEGQVAAQPQEICPSSETGDAGFDSLGGLCDNPAPTILPSFRPSFLPSFATQACALTGN